MVSAVINISDHANRILNIVKAKYNLRDKSEAINIVTQIYEEDVLEPELKPEYDKKLKHIIKNEKRIPVKNFRKEYGLD